MCVCNNIVGKIIFSACKSCGCQGRQTRSSIHEDLQEDMELWVLTMNKCEDAIVWQELSAEIKVSFVLINGSQGTRTRGFQSFFLTTCSF